MEGIELTRDEKGKLTYSIDESKLDEEGKKLYTSIKRLNKFTNLVKKIYLIPVSAIILGLGINYGTVELNRYTISNSQSIKDQNHLEQILKRNKEKLEIKGKNIYVRYDDNIKTSFSEKNKDNSYSIFLAKDQRKESVLFHELFHVSDGNTEEKLKGLEGFLKFNFYYEPKTAINTWWNLGK